MNETIKSAFRTLLTVVGSFLIGKNFFGNPLDNSTIMTIIGIALTLISVIWGMLSKDVQNEAIQSLIRQVVMFAGGILIAKGYVTPDKWNLIIGAIAAILPWFQSSNSRALSRKLQNGTESVHDLTV